MPSAQKRKIVFLEDDTPAQGAKGRGKAKAKTAFSSLPTGSGDLSFAIVDSEGTEARPHAEETRRVRVPNLPPSTSSDATGLVDNRPLLSDKDYTECGESYTDDEKTLNEFLKLHPMLSINAVSRKTLSHFVSLLDTTDVPAHEVQTVGKAHDDLFLRPANCLAGERPCVQGELCIGSTLASLRFGAETDKKIVLREYLLPDENDAFIRSGTLPVTRGKCLLCTRYYHSYMFRLLRADATVASNVKVPIVAFQNHVGATTGDECCTHVNEVGTADEEDKYPESSLLSVDPSFSTTAASRGAMSCFLTRPVVSFNSSNYSYVQSQSGGYEIVQHFHARGDESTLAQVVSPRVP